LNVTRTIRRESAHRGHLSWPIKSLHTQVYRNGRTGRPTRPLTLRSKLQKACRHLTRYDNPVVWVQGRNNKRGLFRGAFFRPETFRRRSRFDTTICAAAGRCGLGCGARCVPLEFLRKPLRKSTCRERAPLIWSARPQPRAQRRLRHSTIRQWRTQTWRTP
jgi:hypothetical protein